jgi:hypothetical protein
MWLWTVVVGVLVGLHMAWTPPGWAQGGFVPTLVPGDVGTRACREVQLAVQGEVGNETNPPYQTHPQYVGAAVLAAKPALAGEITGACYLCIVLPFGKSIPINAQKSCGPDLCEVSGGPGWGNMVRPGGNGAFIASATTPQACCLACDANPQCAQWAFTTSCQHNVPPNQCVAPSPIVFINSGIIRCPAP